MGLMLDRLLDAVSVSLHAALPALNQGERIEGVETVAAQTRLFRASARHASVGLIDGRPGIVVGDGDRIAAVLVIRIEEHRIVHYDVVADPRRLALLEVQR